MLTRSIVTNILNTQYEKGYLEYDDLPRRLRMTVNDKYKHKKLMFNRNDLQMYYKDRIRPSGQIYNILCDPI